MKRVVVCFVFVALFCSRALAFAQLAEERSTPEQLSASLVENIKQFFSAANADYFFAFMQGYDNNVYLNSQRKDDFFNQFLFEPTYTYALTDERNLVVGYELMGLFYYDATDVSFLKNAFLIGVQEKLDSKLDLSADYRFAVNEYVNTSGDDFLGHRLRLQLKHALPNNWRHGLKYELIVKDYTDRYVRTTATQRLGKTRSDTRNAIQYELGKYFTNDSIKVTYQYYFNNSTERYLNYYDYDSHKTTVSLTHLFTDEVFGYLSFARQYRDYRSRTLSVDANVYEWDRSYLLTSGLYYNLNEAVTVGCNYAYRQNWSNEPTQRYSGSTVSFDVYYKF